MNKLVWIYNPFLYFAPSYLLVIHTEDSVLSDDNWAPFKGLNKGLKKKKSRVFFFFWNKPTDLINMIWWFDCSRLARWGIPLQRWCWLFCNVSYIFIYLLILFFIITTDNLSNTEVKLTALLLQQQKRTVEHVLKYRITICQVSFPWYKS